VALLSEREKGRIYLKYGIGSGIKSTCLDIDDDR
jgi:hypothetical protein